MFIFLQFLLPLTSYNVDNCSPVVCDKFFYKPDSTQSLICLVWRSNDAYKNWRRCDFIYVVFDSVWNEYLGNELYFVC